MINTLFDSQEMGLPTYRKNAQQKNTTTTHDNREYASLANNDENDHLASSAKKVHNRASTFVQLSRFFKGLAIGSGIASYGALYPHNYCVQQHLTYTQAQQDLQAKQETCSKKMLDYVTMIREHTESLPGKCFVKAHEDFPTLVEVSKGDFAFAFPKFLDDACNSTEHQLEEPPDPPACHLGLSKEILEYLHYGSGYISGAAFLIAKGLDYLARDN